jgi:hypothetical protein
MVHRCTLRPPGSPLWGCCRDGVTPPRASSARRGAIVTTAWWAVRRAGHLGAGGERLGARTAAPAFSGTRQARRYALHYLPTHAAPRLWLRPGQCGARHAGAASMAWAQEHPAYGQVHRAGAGQVQKLLARLGSRLPLIVYDASFPGRITKLRFRTFQVCAKDLRVLPEHPEPAVSWHSGF